MTNSEVTQSDETTYRRTSAGTGFDAVIIGAGFAGMYMLYKLRQMGFSARVFERGTNVGGTWYWNRYPGARCDVPSLQYSYQFSEELQQEWKWTKKFSDQAEILKYANHVADRFELRRDIQFNTSIESAIYDEGSKRWTVTTDSGEKLSSTFCIMATGCLSSKNIPEFDGMEKFRGDAYHTGNWPHDPVDFTNKKVGIIGTGSTGIQAIPVIAGQAGHLKVFQRTPQYSVPQRNQSMDTGEEARIKADYRGYRERNNNLPLAMDINQADIDQATFDVTAEDRQIEYEKRWKLGGMSLLLSYTDSMTDVAANNTVADFIKTKIKDTVTDQSVAEALLPEHVYACKRPCMDTDYFETYNRPNVTLIDCSKSGIQKISEKGVIVDGVEHELDCLVFATGFDAMTGSLLRIDIRGKDGLSLRDKWAEGPRSFLGLSSSGFPNLFTITGPGSPSVLANMIPGIEQHVNWISECLDYMRRNGHASIEATTEAEEPWHLRVQELANQTLWNACDNWYQGANIPGKPRVFMPYVDWVDYVDQCEQVVQDSYRGFTLS